MKKQKRIRSGFLGLVHVLALAVPLVFLLYIFLVSFFNGFSAESINGVASMSTNYDNTFDVDSFFAYFNSNYLFTFGFIDVDFLSLMGINTNLSYMVFINWYVNYLINMELVLFLPEVLLIFMKIARNLVLSWSDKIHGGY